MTVRDDILKAARSLAGRGRQPFSPAELIAEARTQGCNYPDTTLRTHIVGSMCVDAPDNYAVRYGDLKRVGRGLYRLVVDAEEYAERRRSPLVARTPMASRSVREEPSPAVATEEWSWEGNVQAAVVSHLASQGWSIRRVADTASGEQGVDIEAIRGDERMIVEVKGYPTSTYVRGPKAGQAKPTSAPLQARHYFSNALLSGMLDAG